MRSKLHLSYRRVLFAIFAFIVALFALHTIRFFSCPYEGRPPAEATLYVLDPNDCAIPIGSADSNSLITSQTNIVIVTHGWYERTVWPQEMASAIRDKTDPNQWLCAWLDWRTQARSLNPNEAVRYARNTAGPMIAEKIIQLSKNWNHIHLIGHSAGCWAVNEAAKILTDKTNSTIHLTLLDAFVPIGWDIDELGAFTYQRETKHWVEHYFTSDPTPTASRLKNAYNIDLTNVTPGRNQHRFPFHWYYATITGQFNPHRQYANKKLFTKANDIEYGFSRSLEKGNDNWRESKDLKPGNEPVRITQP